MNKETKIGLVVLGVLLAVFSGLLVRRFMPVSIADPATETASAGTPLDASKTTVVPLEPTAVVSPEIAVRMDEHEVRPEVPASRNEPPAELPRAGYMPESSTATVARDRYGRELTPSESADDIPPASGDPFQAGTTEVDRAARESVAQAPRRLRVANEPESPDDGSDRSPKRVKNPLRRLSAEVPIEESNDEPLSTTGAEPALSSPDPAVPSDLEPQTPAPAEVEESPQAAPLADREAAAESAPRSRDWNGSDRRYTTTPPSQPDPPVDPAPGGKYTVQPNDNLWSISEKVYGTGRYFKAIGEHNRAKLPRADRLQVGSVIDVPAASVLENRYPQLCPKQRKSVVVQPRAVRASAQQPVSSDGVYVVEEGDTLFDIARYELGKASRWAEIYELNRDKLGGDIDYLQPGTELVMPPRGESVTRGAGSRYQR